MNRLSCGHQQKAAWTVHAERRAGERGVPPSVCDALERGDVRVGGYDGDIRVVRRPDGFWVAPEVKCAITTVYFVPTWRLDRWACRNLRNIRENVRLHRLSVHQTPNEVVTSELRSLWMSSRLAA